MRSAALALCLAAAVAAPSAQAAPDPLVAVLELRNKLHKADAEEVDAAYLSDRVRAEVLESKAPVRVMTRENLNALVQSQGRTLADCEGQCEVQTAKLIGADEVISGEVLRVGSALKLSLRLHDTASAQLLAAKQVTGKNIEELDNNIGPVVAELLAPLRGGKPSLGTLAAAPEPAPVQPVQAQPPAAEPATVPGPGALRMVFGEPRSGKWTLHADDGRALCGLPCTRSVPRGNTFYLVRAAEAGDGPARFDVPSGSEFASGRTVSVVHVPSRGAPKLALALGIASLATAAVGFKVQGETPVCRNAVGVEQHPGVCTPSDPNIWNTGARTDWASGPGPKLVGAGAVIAVASAIWFVWSHGERFEAEPVKAATSLELDPAALAVRF